MLRSRSQSARTSGLLSDASAETVSPAVRDGVRQTEKIEIVARNKRARKEGTDTEDRTKNGAAPDDSEILTLCLFGPTFSDSHEPGRNYVPVTSIPTENHSQINEMSKSSAAPARAILSGPSNWDKWRRELRNRTDKTIHSLIFTNEEPLEPPERPEFRHYAPDAVRLADLSAESVVSSKQNAFDEDLPIRQWFKRLEASTAPEAGYMMNLTRTKYSTHLKRFNAKDLDSWIDKWEDIMPLDNSLGYQYEQGSRILDAKSEATQGKLFDFDRYGPPAAAPVNPVVHNPAAAAVGFAAVLAAQAPTESQWTVERVVRDVKHLAESREAEKPRGAIKRGGAFHADKAAADADDADEVPPAKKKKLDREPLEREPYSKRDPCLACRRKGHELEGCWQVIEEARPKGYNPPPERYLKMTRERVADDPQPRMRGRLVGSANPAFVFSAESPGLKGSEYPLKNSTLLDCGASLHINNKLSRFRSFKKAKNDFIVAGDSLVRIEGFGRVNKVAYCPGFSSSLVSLQTLIDDDQIFWDTLSEPMRLVRKGQTIGITERKYQQFVVEYQPVETEFPDFNRKLEEPAQEILDLPLKETASFGTPVLVTLAYKGVRIKGPKTVECERQVSRRPPDEERDKPCYEIWIDWTDLARDHENYTPSLEWSFLLHEDLQGKGTRSSLHEENLSLDEEERDDKGDVSFQHSGPEWWSREVRRISTERARVMRIASRLPHSLWKEIIEAACYLRNRTPREPRFAAENANEGEADWKSPIDLFTGRKISSHLRAYGCRAYAMTANAQLGLRKRWKLDPRAHIGYLIGYKSTNIFLIWVPLLKKVIATRDVVFDEYTFFEGGGERMPLPASIGEMIQQIEIPEDQTANQAILDEETDEDTDIEDFEDDDISMAEDNEVEEQGQQQSEEQEKEDYGRARELEDAYLTPPASDPEEEEPHGVFSVHFPYADPNGVVVKAPFQVDLEPLQAQKRVRVQDDPEEEAHPEGWVALLEERHFKPTLKALEPFDQPELDQSYIDRFADFVPVQIEDGVHGAFTAGRLFRPKSAKVHKRDLPEPPQTQKQLEKHPYREEFTQAQRDHLASHAEMGSFDEVFWTKAAGKQVLGCKWVFIYKTDKHGNLQKCKARLVVCGNQQEKGDLPTRATTLAGMSFRTLMAIAAEHDLELEQMDAVNALFMPPRRRRSYLHEDATGVPEEGESPTPEKSSLRTTPLAAPLATDAYVVSRGTGIQKRAVTVFFYVDDIIWAFRKEDEGLTRLGEPRWFLGIRILRDRQRKTLWLTQDAYIDKIAYKFLLNNDNAPESLKLPDTPMISDEELLPATSQFFSAVCAARASARCSGAFGRTNEVECGLDKVILYNFHK
ncbi:reverse transcriptase (RNA-dependent DNA polymerase) [Hirsutella rhossiliensis]